MKKLMLLVLMVPMLSFAEESQSQCISRVKQSLAACGEVCDEVMDNKKEVKACYKACGEEAREKFINECKVPLRR